MIDKEAIDKRLEALRRDLQALDFRMAAVQGAIQDCEWWLTQLPKVTEEEKSDDGTTNRLG